MNYSYCLSFLFIAIFVITKVNQHFLPVHYFLDQSWILRLPQHINLPETNPQL